MNLGIKRELLGDIIVKDNCGYILCLEHIAPYICENLERVRHTSVKCEKSNLPNDLKNEPEPTEIFAASKRIDVVIAAVYNLSRNETSKLIKAEKVFVNSRLVTSNSYMLCDNDIVSVRGSADFLLIKKSKLPKKAGLCLK